MSGRRASNIAAEPEKSLLSMLDWKNSVRIDPRELKEYSKLTKEEWKEFTKSVWQIANTSHPIHPAVFPEEIPRRLIKLFSMVGDIVLDGFCGTATTGAVAFQLGRHFVDLIRAESISRSRRRT